MNFLQSLSVLGYFSIFSSYCCYCFHFAVSLQLLLLWRNKILEVGNLFYVPSNLKMNSLFWQKRILNWNTINSDTISSSVHFSRRVISWLFETPCISARQASLSITNSWNLLKLVSVESVMPSNHLILCWPPLLPPSIFLSIRVFTDESALYVRWPNYWSFCLSISCYNEYSRLFPLGWTGWNSLQSKGLSRVFSNTTVQKHQFFGAQLSL